MRRSMQNEYLVEKIHSILIRSCVIHPDAPLEQLKPRGQRTLYNLYGICPKATKRQSLRIIK